MRTSRRKMCHDRYEVLHSNNEIHLFSNNNQNRFHVVLCVFRNSLHFLPKLRQWLGLNNTGKSLNLWSKMLIAFKTNMLRNRDGARFVSISLSVKSKWVSSRCFRSSCFPELF